MQPPRPNTEALQPHAQPEFHDADRKAMEAKIREALETLSQIRVTVMNHESADEQVLQQRVDRLVRGYAEMHVVKDRLNVSVPEEVLAYIKDGRNPDEFTSQFMERVASENQFTNGKIAALTNFKQEFEAKLREFFPEESSERLDCQQTEQQQSVQR
ncbi:RNA polymerase II mediator complex subunit [Coemansia spiralis]|uniref:Mediator of RNA polymerase II transcription subunit 10 n=2 Tax=Coemansia TaxID=4863 RepID=A0A9W8L091_9FUNG|nr:transcription factor subunit Med10 of mediator complex-domain-containing protein [Coemansia spiralis]KAJ1994898.1 RNA polymerase II mediator complex subunit [Coemansia umbellata]KAJ2624665.1 RNA polymerase II mediator complex subunit [Coemansia sp. RSA 1358]KAJ2679749.1 RNA polymerase II mediator complex subunit [Coemansia spiralis]